MLRVMAAVQSIAGEHQALIDDIMEQCDKVSRMPLAAESVFQCLEVPFSMSEIM